MTSKISEKEYPQCGFYKQALDPPVSKNDPFWVIKFKIKDTILNLFTFSIPIDQVVCTNKKLKNSL